MKTARILACCFPFPPQDPPALMPEPSTAKCPVADMKLLEEHTRIPRDDEELLAAIRSFARWFYAPTVSEETLEPRSDMPPSLGRGNK